MEMRSSEADSVVADRAWPPSADQPEGPGDSSGTAHQATLERVLGRIFAALAALWVAVFWSSSATLAGQQPGSMATNLLLSGLLIGQALRALRRPPSQRDLWLMAVASGSLLLASRELATPGSPFLNNNAYLFVIPVAVAWGVWSARFVVPVPVLLVVLATGVWDPRQDLPVEQAVGSLAIVACTSWAARLLRAGARRADADARALSRRMADQDATLAAEEAQRRAANAVHDDVLSVLRAASVTDQKFPWNILVSKARAAQDSLAQQVFRGGYGLANLRSALRRAVESAAELDVRCDIDSDLDVPQGAVEALSAAAGEALRNVAAHAGVRSAAVTASRSQSGGATVTVSDDGLGFDLAWVGPASSGLRNSVRARLSDAGGHAQIISAPGQGTSVVLTWDPPQQVRASAADPIAWARRMAPRPQLIFVGFMLPILLIGLVSLCLRWHDMRWPAAAVAVLGAQVGISALCAWCLSQVRMTRSTAVGLAAANAILAAVGSLAVAPGTTDSYAYWVSTNTGIVIAAVYFIRGPVFGIATLALDMAVLTVGLRVTGSAISPGQQVSTLTAPAIGAGVAAAMLAAFRSLSSQTESQPAAYRDRLRRQARAEVISRVDRAALEHARRVAGPVLELVVSDQAPSPALCTAAALANATLRDELLAPGFLAGELAQRVRAARTVGASVTVNFARQSDAGLVKTARELLAAALADLGASDNLALQVHPPAEERPALLIMRIHSARSGQDALRRSANECGAMVSNLSDRELLVRLQPATERPPFPQPERSRLL
jgi:signal transduction histidine kinase